MADHLRWDVGLPLRQPSAMSTEFTRCTTHHPRHVMFLTENWRCTRGWQRRSEARDSAGPGDLGVISIIKDVGKAVKLDVEVQSPESPDL